ncbi:hypothetical protein VPH35_030518 [Triticum aestivum]
MLVLDAGSKLVAVARRRHRVACAGDGRHLPLGLCTQLTGSTQRRPDGQRDARSTGIIPLKRGTTEDGAEWGGCGSIDEDQSARTLGAAALDLVDQDINHPGLFEGGFDQARSLLSRLREGDVGCKT